MLSFTNLTSPANLKIAVGARPAGMGEAYMSITDDATAIFWNLDKQSKAKVDPKRVDFSVLIL